MKRIAMSSVALLLAAGLVLLAARGADPVIAAQPDKSAEISKGSHDGPQHAVRNLMTRKCNAEPMQSPCPYTYDFTWGSNCNPDAGDANCSGSVGNGLPCNDGTCDAGEPYCGAAVNATFLTCVGGGDLALCRCWCWHEHR